MVYWLAIFLLYCLVFARLVWWSWYIHFPVFTAFLGQNILFSVILFSVPYTSRAYFMAYCIGKGADIVLGMLSIIELSCMNVDPITYTMAIYFMCQMLILSVFATLHWHAAEQFIKPLVIVFEVIWLVTLGRLRKRVDEAIELRYPSYRGEPYDEASAQTRAALRAD
jgi:hypothetical protein